MENATVIASVPTKIQVDSKPTNFPGIIVVAKESGEVNLCGFEIPFFLWRKKSENKLMPATYKMNHMLRSIDQI